MTFYSDCHDFAALTSLYCISMLNIFIGTTFINKELLLRSFFIWCGILQISWVSNKELLFYSSNSWSKNCFGKHVIQHMYWYQYNINRKYVHVYLIMCRFFDGKYCTLIYACEFHTNGDTNIIVQWPDKLIIVPFCSDSTFSNIL